MVFRDWIRLNAGNRYGKLVIYYHYSMSIHAVILLKVKRILMLSAAHDVATDRYVCILESLNPFALWK